MARRHEPQMLSFIPLFFHEIKNKLSVHLTCLCTFYYIVINMTIAR
jgi:hypothetical protein